MRVVLIAAITADGFIGQSDHHTADWTGGEDKKEFVRLTKELGVVIMGSNTYATIGRALPGRRNIMYTSRPTENAIDGVETTDEAPEALIKRLEQQGHSSVAICGGTSIYSQFMEAGLVTELYLMVIPVLFGTGLYLFNTPLSTQLHLLDSETLSDGVMMLHYVVDSTLA